MATDNEQDLHNGDLEQNSPPDKAPLPAVPPDIAEFLGDRPIVNGESAEQYDKLLSRLAAFIKPIDTIEWIWTKDITDASWEARRARRLRDQMLDLGRFKAMKRVAENILQEKRAVPEFGKLVDKTVAEWMGPGGEAVMTEFLAKRDLDPSAIAAEAFLIRSQPYEQLERIATAADKRRDAAFRDIARHRAGPLRPLRQSNVVDAEAEDVTNESPGDTAVATVNPQ